jgi:hypothetical protein
MTWTQVNLGLVLLAFPLLWAGCASTGDIEQPELTGIKTGDDTAAEQKTSQDAAASGGSVVKQSTTNVTFQDAGGACCSIAAIWLFWSRRRHRQAVDRLVHSIEKTEWAGDERTPERFRAELKTHIRDKGRMAQRYTWWNSWTDLPATDAVQNLIHARVKKL